GVVAAKPVCPSLDQLRGWLAEFEAAVAHDEPSALFRVLRKAVPGFSEMPNSGTRDIPVSVAQALPLSGRS
ncbi:MAG TPA: hypothetical protein VFT69_12935, partial [Pseudolabrys sp.]|nr:hypothetical protein [Pseudolabrys sp.]